MSAEIKDKRIIESFKILYRIGIPLGFSCYTLPNSADERPLIKVTTLDVVLFIFMFLLNGYSLYHNYWFWERVSAEQHMDALFNVGIKFITTGGIMFTIVGAITVFFMREQIWNIVVSLQDISERVKIFVKTQFAL